MAPVKIGAVMLTSAFHTSLRHIAIVAMACLCVLLGGPSYAAGAESLIIAGATYDEPGVSGPGWTWTDADHLELNGYAGEAIGADGDLVVTLCGRNSVTETRATDLDISRCGMEVWGDLTLRCSGSFVATGSQCGMHVSGALVVDGCVLDARADGADVADELVAGVVTGGLTVRGGGRVVAVGVRGGEDFAAVGARAGSGACGGECLAAAGAGTGRDVRAYGVYLLDGDLCDGAGAGRLDVDASWLDATGADNGVACLGGSLTAARFVTPAGGAFGAGGVVDAGGAAAPHVVVEPEGATAPAGETDASETSDNGGPTAKEPGAGPALNPAPGTSKTTTTTTTTVTKTASAKASRPKAATAAPSPLPKTADNNWIVASSALFLLGIALLGVAHRS